LYFVFIFASIFIIILFTSYCLDCAQMNQVFFKIYFVCLFYFILYLFVVRKMEQVWTRTDRVDQLADALET